MLKREKIQHVLLLILLFLSGVFGVLLLSKYVVRPSDEKKQVATTPSPSPIEIEEFTESAPIISPDKTKTIIVRDYLDWKEIFLKDKDGKEKRIEKVDGILVLTDSFLWSPDSSKVSYITGTASLGHYITVADLETGKLTAIDGEGAFLNEVEDEDMGEYDHIYAGVVEWKNTTELVITVDGIHSRDDKKSQTMKFLMSVETGEAIKRLL